MKPLSLDLERDAMLSGTTAIEASAGTGKTYSIEEILVRRILGGAEISRVLLVTFTRAAADEMAERTRAALAQRLREVDPAPTDRERGLLERALLDFDSACITTIHGFCNRMLEEQTSEAGEWSLAGWNLDPDPDGSAELAVLDAWSAASARDGVMLHFAGEMRSVRRPDRHTESDVDEADATAQWNSARDAWSTASRALLGEPEWPAVLASVAGHLKSVEKSAVAAIAVALERAQAAPKCELEMALAELSDAVGSDGAESVGGVESLVQAVPYAALKRGAAAVGAVRAALAEIDGAKCLAKITALRATIEPAITAARQSLGADAKARHRFRMERLKLFNYQDLLERMDCAVAQRAHFGEAVSGRFDLVFVDEAQDTDRLQARIIERLFAGPQRALHTALYLVGDPKQSIYLFRGADLASYLRLRAMAGDQVRSLDKSYRSDPKLVDGVARLFALPDPFCVAGITLEGVTSAFTESRMRGARGADLSGVRLFEVAGSESWLSIADSVAAAIAASLDDGISVQVGNPRSPDAPRPLAPRDIAVLCHSNEQVRDIHRALRARGVASVCLGRGSVFASPATMDLVRLIGAMASPNNRTRALGACAGAIMGMTATDCTRRPAEWLEGIHSLARDAERHGVASAISRLVASRLGTIIAMDDGERHEMDLLHLIELLHGAEAAGIASPIALATWLAAQAAAANGPAGDASRQRLATGHDAVRVQTLHSSKGLTYGVTWLPTFTLKKRTRADATDTTIEEARRTLYVGLTRSRWQSNVVWNAACGDEASPLKALVDEHGGVDALVNGSDGSISRETLRVVGEVENRERAVIALVEPRTPPIVPAPSLMVSFTGLSALVGHDSDAEQATDHDQSSAPTRTGEPGAAASKCDRAIRAVCARGKALGTAVHSALEEEAAFASVAVGNDRSAFAEALQEHLVGAAKSAGPDECASLASAISDALAAPIDLAGCPSVAECAARPRGTLRELKIATHWEARAAEIALAFDEEPAPWARRFAKELRGLGSAAHLGLFIGTLDLVRREGDEWFIYDYKTNDLGSDAAAYRSLDSAMITSRYPLQAALYSAALRQWISARTGVEPRGTNPIGGVAYLFLRGIDAAMPGQGIWTWKPSTGLLDALGSLMQGGSGVVER